MARRLAQVLPVLLVLLQLTAGSAAAQQELKLTILHTNDTHGHLLPYSYPDTYNPSSPLAQLLSRRDIGGAARRATLVKRVRAERGHATLLIDAGDVCDGTPFSTEYHGNADVAAMNAIGYDVACPGNHEFSNELPQVRKLIAAARFPLVSANTTVAADGKSLYQPYVIRRVGGVRIAFFGLLTYDAHTYRAARDGLTMQPPIEEARRLVPSLRRQADLVVAITHIGVDEDQQLAKQVPGIDVIVGGHSHTLLPQPLFVATPTSSRAPRRQHAVNGTVIVQDFQWAGTLGRLDLTLRRQDDGSWAVERYAGRLLPVTSTVPEDPAVARVVSSYWAPIRGKYGAVVGTAAGDFADRGPDHAEYNLMADAVRAAASAQFAIENMGGVRATLARGPITFGDIATMDPFDNTIVTFRMTGLQLKAILARERPAVSGIRYAVDATGLTAASIGGVPIDDDRVYAGATNSYYAAFILKDVADKADTKRARRDALVSYIRSRGTVTPAYDGRRVLRGIPDGD